MTLTPKTSSESERSKLNAGEGDLDGTHHLGAPKTDGEVAEQANGNSGQNSIYTIAGELPEVFDGKQSRCAHSGRSRIIWGFVIVFFIAISWVGSTQFAKSTYNKSFNAPYFTTWYTTCFMMTIYPFFLIPRLCEKKPWRLKTYFRESSRIFGPSGICLLSFFKYTFTFTTLFMVTNYVYIRALGVIAAADVSALFSSCSAFVYVFSFILLKERIFVIRVFSVLLSIGGIVLMAYTEGFQGPTLTGVLLSVVAAMGAAMYNVLFKRVVGNATSSQVALFLSMVGVCTTLLLWPIVLAFHFTKYERINWSDMPWGFLNGTAVLALAFNYLVNFGIALTFPLFISLGTVLGIPINGIADTLFRGSDFGPYKIVAAVMIILSFLLMLIPTETVERWEHRKRLETPEEGRIVPDITDPVA